MQSNKCSHEKKNQTINLETRMTVWCQLICVKYFTFPGVFWQQMNLFLIFAKSSSYGYISMEKLWNTGKIYTGQM